MARILLLGWRGLSAAVIAVGLRGQTITTQIVAAGNTSSSQVDLDLQVSNAATGSRVVVLSEIVVHPRWLSVSLPVIAPLGPVTVSVTNGTPVDVTVTVPADAVTGTSTKVLLVKGYSVDSKGERKAFASNHFLNLPYSAVAMPQQLAFPDTVVGGTAPPQVLTVTNSGSAAASVRSIATAGANQADFSTSSSCSVVPAASSCNVNVTFQPVAAGARSASVEVEVINRTVTTKLIASVSGVGLAPPTRLVTSSKDGSWSSPATWGGNAPPGKGDQAIIGHRVIVDTDTIIGDSKPGSFAITEKGAGMIVVAGAVLTVRGNVLVHATQDLEPKVRLTAGAGWVWDSSLAPAGTQYSMTADGVFAFQFLEAICTAAKPCSVTSRGSPGFFSGYPAYYGGGLVAKYTNFSYLGTSSVPAWNVSFFANSGQAVDVSDSTFDHCGIIRSDSASGNHIVNWVRNLHTNSLGFSAVNLGFIDNKTAGGTRMFDSNVFDVAFGADDRDHAATVTDAALINNFFGGGFYAAVGSGLNGWASNSKWNLFHNSNNFQTAGDLIENYDVVDQFEEMHNHNPDLNVNLNHYKINGNVFESTYLVTNLNGQDGVVDPDTAAGPVTIELKNNLILPAGDGAGSQSLIDLLGPVNDHVDIQHNTLTVPSNAFGSITMECEYGCVSPVNHRGKLSNNIFWSQDNSGKAGMAAQFNVEAPVLDLFDPAEIQRNVRTTNLRQISTYRPASENVNQGNSYGGAWSVTPGWTDIVTDPSFFDATRNLATFDTAYLGTRESYTWASRPVGFAFVVGEVASDASASYYGGATINYRCILAHAKGTANAQPGVGSEWHKYWEFNSLNSIRTGMSNGTTYPDPLNTGGARTPPIATLLNWVKAGFRPTNDLLRGVGTDGLDIGAVPLQ